ncbi:MAG: host-nuclease inhibitor Gam family protein [Victivallaceae bacterium]|nr:host-nuclease inhibitor Gam family protein [Victivallaceae bacterium]
MPVTRTSDNREYESTTVSEADKKFNRLAKLEIDIKAKKAAAEKRIATIKAKLESETDAAVSEYKELAEWLDAYILANKGRFAKPRMRPTAFGKYGLRKATKLSITDEQLVIKQSDALGMALYEKKYKILKKAVESAISEGKNIAGAKIISGDIAGFTVDKKLLDAAIK